MYFNYPKKRERSKSTHHMNNVLNASALHINNIQVKKRKREQNDHWSVNIHTHCDGQFN